MHTHGSWLLLSNSSHIDVIHLCVTTILTGLNWVCNAASTPDSLLHCLMSLVVLPVGCNENFEIFLFFFLLPSLFFILLPNLYFLQNVPSSHTSKIFSLTSLPCCLPHTVQRTLPSPSFHFSVNFFTSAHCQSSAGGQQYADSHGIHTPSASSFLPLPSPCLSSS